tara:strand:- start:1064 stop:1717 length:654 start_codon:yes stop_codon:yes gene_type:complete
MKKAGFFWIGYADLMTSLFFIMLVLYVVSFTILKSKQSQLQAAADQLKEIENVQKAIESLDSKYYQFDAINKRYKLNIEAHFKPNSSNITDIPLKRRNELAKAGGNLFYKIDSIVRVNKSVDYLLIIEGNAARYNGNYVNDPNKGYRLSYNRALALFNFWKNKGFDFGKIGNNQCEIMIAGSGYFSQSRDIVNEQNNKRFTIQVTSKVGKYLNRNEE